LPAQQFRERIGSHRAGREQGRVLKRPHRPSARKYLSPPGVKDRRHGLCVEPLRRRLLCAQRQRLKSRHSYQRDRSGQRECACGRDTDPQASEGPRSDSYRDPVELGERHVGSSEQLRDQR
jgi:hypothetical protein